MNQVELVMRRRAVAWFIDADPVFIDIHRRLPAERNPDTGGYLPGLIDDLDTQKARIVQNKRRFNAGIVNSEAGDIPHTDYLLLANHNMDFEAEDEFVWRGDNYKIIAIYGARHESILATIDLLGGENRNAEG